MTPLDQLVIAERLMKDGVLRKSTNRFGYRLSKASIIKYNKVRQLPKTFLVKSKSGTVVVEYAFNVEGVVRLAFRDRSLLEQSVIMTAIVSKLPHSKIGYLDFWAMSSNLRFVDVLKQGKAHIIKQNESYAAKLLAPAHGESLGLLQSEVVVGTPEPDWDNDVFGIPISAEVL